MDSGESAGVEGEIENKSKSSTAEDAEYAEEFLACVFYLREPVKFVDDLFS